MLYTFDERVIYDSVNGTLRHTNSKADETTQLTII